MTLKRMMAQIEKRRDAVGRERDKLDAMISDLEGLRDSCDRAWDNLQSAIDALSEQA